METKSLAEQLIDDYRMELPPEDIAWNASPGSCGLCEILEHSHQGKPGLPPGGYDALSYVCTECGRRWWQFNTHFHLWKNVTDPGEWDGIRRWQIIKDAGYPLPGEGQ